MRVAPEGPHEVTTVPFHYALVVVNGVVHGDPLRRMVLEAAPSYNVLDPQGPSGLGRVVFSCGRPEVHAVACFRELEQDLAGVRPWVAVFVEQGAQDVEEDVHLR